MLVKDIQSKRIGVSANLLHLNREARWWTKNNRFRLKFASNDGRECANELALELRPTVSRSDLHWKYTISNVVELWSWKRRKWLSKCRLIEIATSELSNSYDKKRKNIDSLSEVELLNLSQGTYSAIHGLTRWIRQIRGDKGSAIIRLHLCPLPPTTKTMSSWILWMMAFSTKAVPRDTPQFDFWREDKANQQSTSVDLWQCPHRIGKMFADFSDV
jgi:hypothetical protein